MTDPLSNQDVSTKNYVDTNAFTTAGCVVPVDIKLSVGSDLVRSLGCNDLGIGKKVALLLGSNSNMLTYSIPNLSGSPVPVKLKTIAGFAILFNQYPICNFRHDVILCSEPIDMDQHSFKNVKSPVNKFDAVNRPYVDCIKYKSATGNIPNTLITYHTLFIFPAAKGFNEWKDNNM